MNEVGCFVFDENIGRNKSGNMSARYVCFECGESIYPSLSDVKRGRVKGKCKNPDVVLKRKKLNNVYWNMLARCYNPESENFQYYGGKGIHVCDRWVESFENFVNDMIPTYEDGLWLDREDGEKDYSFENCRWTTVSIQQHNKKKKDGDYTSGYKGVSYRKDSGNWRASITKDGKRTAIGSFETEVEAAVAYNNAAKEHGIEERHLNKIPPETVAKMKERFVISL